MASPCVARRASVSSAHAALPPVAPDLVLLALCLLPGLLVCAAPVEARVLSAKIARVTTAVAVLEQVRSISIGRRRRRRADLRLRAARIDAPDLGYRFGDVDWQCPLSRDGKGGWRCDGMVRSRSRPAAAAVARPGDAPRPMSRLCTRRGAPGSASPGRDAGRHPVDLTRVPLAWAQALSSQAWAEGRLKAGHAGRTPDGAHAGDAAAARRRPACDWPALALETPDGSIAAENRRRAPAYRLSQVERRPASSPSTASCSAANCCSAPPTSPCRRRRSRCASMAPSTATRAGACRDCRWRDGDALVAQGSLAFSPDATLRDRGPARRIAPTCRRSSRATSPAGSASAGLQRSAVAGAADVRVRMARGAAGPRSTPTCTTCRCIDAQGPLPFRRTRWRPAFLQRRRAVDSMLRWRGGDSCTASASARPRCRCDSGDGELRLRQRVIVPMLGGSLRFDSFESASARRRARPADSLRPGPRGARCRRSWPRRWTGRRSAARSAAAFPKARYADDRLDFDGGLAMHVFDGTVAVSSLAMERPFGVAPTLSADIAIDDSTCSRGTEVFGFGSITGRARRPHRATCAWSTGARPRSTPNCIPTRTARHAPAHQPARGAGHFQRRRRRRSSAACRGRLDRPVRRLRLSPHRHLLPAGERGLRHGRPAFSRATALLSSKARACRG